MKTANEFCSEFDKGNSLLVIALDLTAAFDTIDFEILDQIIEKRFLITGTCNEWIMSYITNRKQQTQVNVLSSDSDVHYGVTRGSSLGPLVFLVYITPISDLLTKVVLRNQMYADDTVLYASMRTNQEETSMEDLKWKVRKVFEACTALKLKLNPDKTEVLLLSTKKKRPNIGSFELNDSEVKLNKSLITLGVTADECLNFDMQINRVKSSFYNELRKLHRVKHYLSLESRKIAVQSLILSRLDYCNSLLGGTNKSSIEKLQRVQNAACRFIFNLWKQELCKKIDIFCIGYLLLKELILKS